jgi:hypothetical protein
MSRVGELRYPDAPGYKRPGGTSEQAARAVAGSAATLRARVLTEFAKHPIAGATADEVAGALGCSVLSIRPRVSELNRSGAIVASGSRRKNDSGLSATVWKVAPPLPPNHGRDGGLP